MEEIQCEIPKRAGKKRLQQAKRKVNKAQEAHTTAGTE